MSSDTQRSVQYVTSICLPQISLDSTLVPNIVGKGYTIKKPAVIFQTRKLHSRSHYRGCLEVFRKVRGMEWKILRKRSMIQSGRRFGLLLRRQICLSQVWLGGLRAVSGLASARLSTDRPRCARPPSPPAKLDSEKFSRNAMDQTCRLD